MITTVVRTLVIYIFLTVCMRIMGKRQIGQLQPVEFVITMLISEIVAMPIEDPDLPMLNSMVSVIVLVSFEIIISVISLKSEKFRKSVQGNAVAVINNGNLDVEKMKELRFSVDDILASLRKKDVFDIGDVQYAIAETDGSLSVMLKPAKQNPTNAELGVKSQPAEIPIVIVSDGKSKTDSIAGMEVSEPEIKKILEKIRLNAEDILILTVTKSGKTDIVKKDKQTSDKRKKKGGKK